MMKRWRGLSAISPMRLPALALFLIDVQPAIVNSSNMTSRRTFGVLVCKSEIKS